MPLQPIKFTPGINTVKTVTLNEGGWSAASNVRFFEGQPQKDSGFVELLTVPNAAIIKALKAWTALDGFPYLGIGGTKALLVWKDRRVLTDITPPGIAAVPINNAVTLDNWGEFLLACPQGGQVYVWEPQKGGVATAVPTLPAKVNFIFVATQQQQLICCGITNSATGLQDPMLVGWTDVGDYTVITPTVSNQAGTFRLAIGSRLVSGLAIPGQNLLWTDIALYSMQYIQPPLVYGFQPLGINCGAVGPHSIGVLGTTVFWMSRNQFFVLTAEGPQQIDCPVWDSVFPNLDENNLVNVVCETDSFYGEVGWSVPQKDGAVIFARVQVKTAAWTASAYHHHTAWIDQNPFGAPIGGHESGFIDQHDMGVNAAGVPASWSLTSGIVMIAEGEETVFLRDLIPDFATEGTGPTVRLSVSFYDYPDKPPRVKGPYLLTPGTQLVHPRGRGRGVQFTFSGNDLNSFVRLGNIRYRAQPDGRR